MERVRGVRKEHSRGGTRTKGLRELGDVHIFTAVPPIWTLPEVSWPKSRDSHKDLDCRCPRAAGFSNKVSSFTFSFLISQVQSWSYFSGKKYPPKCSACQTVASVNLLRGCGWNLAIPQTSCSRWKFLFKVKWKDSQCLHAVLRIGSHLFMIKPLDPKLTCLSRDSLSFGLPWHQQYSSFCALSIFVMLNFDWLMSGIMFLYYNNHSLPVNSHQ